MPSYRNQSIDLLGTYWVEIANPLEYLVRNQEQLSTILLTKNNYQLGSAENILTFPPVHRTIPANSSITVLTF